MVCLCICVVLCTHPSRCSLGFEPSWGRHPVRLAGHLTTWRQSPRPPYLVERLSEAPIALAARQRPAPSGHLLACRAPSSPLSASSSDCRPAETFVSAHLAVYPRTPSSPRPFIEAEVARANRSCCTELDRLHKRCRSPVVPPPLSESLLAVLEPIRA
jgi:hypothetical protein